MQEKQAKQISVLPTATNSSDRTPKKNFPMVLTSLIGREEDIAAASALLQNPEVRLLTLSGPGGVGKTRLGLQLATELQTDFADGALLVQLASVSRPEQVVAAIAHTLGLRESDDRPLLEHVKAFLYAKQVLLLLDNFEQVLAAAPLLPELLLSCSFLKIVVTSRIVLRVQGEQEFAVLPLPLPDAKSLPTREAIGQFSAVKLFVKRARASRFDFQLTDENAPVIAAICARLDGLPLALELAAACIKLFPPRALLARLSSRLTLLTGGGQDTPERQKTLRNAVAWSYDLLSSEEQALFRRLAVFVSGCQLEAVEALYNTLNDSSLPVLDGVTQLLDKSLIQQNTPDGQEPRLTMLETIREFALEMLTASDEMERIQEAHTAYYTALAERAKSELYHHQQRFWLGRLEQEHDNLRAALAFFQTHDEQVKLAHLVGTLGWFWYMHGLLNEGRKWVEQVVAGGTQHLPEAIQGEVISTAGVIAGLLGQSEIALGCCQESVPLCKASGDARNLCASTYMLAHTSLAMGNIAEAQALANDLLTFVSAAGDNWAVGTAHCILGSVALYKGDYERAWQLHEKGIAIFDVEGDMCMNGLVHMMLADVSVAQGDEAKAHMLIQQGRAMLAQIGASWSLGSYFSFWGQIALNGHHEPRARFLLQEALTYQQQMGDQQGMLNTYALLAQVAIHERDYLTARILAEQNVQIARLLRDQDALIGCLEGLAITIAQQGEDLWAVRIWGTIDQLYQLAGLQPSSSIQAIREPFVKLVHDRLGEEAFTAAWVEGQKMTPEQVVTAQDESGTDFVETYQSQPALSPTSDNAQAETVDLTRREMDVLWQLAQGLTNAQIAEQLIITPTTVNSYLRTIYSKLGVSSRTAAVRYAIEHKLVEIR